MSYFEIGIFHPRSDENIGTLWRSAYQLGAAGIFTIGRPYRHQTSDVVRTEFQIPLRQYQTFEEFDASRPVGAVLVGVELGGIPLGAYRHPEQAIYLLGSEANGLSPKALARCQAIITVEAVNKASYNVAVAGSLVMYHRIFVKLSPA